ncbi:MAG: RNA polymerase subunit sigma-70 [Myxococcales bacterium]|nr:RNA polymerase subunit sigma-70 [Myxococcales bacterium]
MSDEGSPEDHDAAKLLPLVYAQLRKIAGSYFRGRNAAHTLQPTALVHEAFLRLVRQDPESIHDRDHFIAVAATAMRQILTDHAVDVLAIDAVLTRLAVLSPRQARIVELQFFGGLTVEEVARAMEVSKSLVEKEWRRARAWIQVALEEPAA